jgi:hypothetical protein
VTNFENKKVLFAVLGGLIAAPFSHAQANLGPITVGAGLQTSYSGQNVTDGDFTNTFALNHARLYVSGPVYGDTIKFMFNTDYDSVTNKIGILDAVAQFSFSPHFNIWAGRFLEPSDRANLYGPFYANEWLVYQDGIQDGYNFVYQGRDNGVMYWGDFGKMKVSVGGFDGASATAKHDIIGAARVQYDFWDKEDGYYLNGTYYGDKNLLALGAAGQMQDGLAASTLDFLLEKKVLNGGAFSIESEYANYNGLGGYLPDSKKSQGAYGLASFLFPKEVPFGKIKGKFELMGKWAKAESHGQSTYVSQRTTEINFSYIIKQFNARVMTFFQDVRFNQTTIPNTWQAGIGLQIQM